MAVEWRELGRTGLRVPRLGLGTAGLVPPFSIGGRVAGFGGHDDARARAAVDRALERGILLFDTSDWFGLGRAERLVGEALAGRAEEALVIAKAGAVPDGERHAISDCSREHLLAASARTLRRLGRRDVSAFLLHGAGPEDVTEETWKALAGIKALGRARATGVSVSDAKWAEVLVEEGRVDVLEAPYNLLNQRHSRWFAEARRRGIGVIVRSPLASGLLSGKYGAKPAFPRDDFRESWWTPEYVAHAAQRASLVRALTGKTMPLPDVALRFVLAEEAVDAVVIGARSPAEVDAAVGAAEAGPLSSDVAARLRDA